MSSPAVPVGGAPTTTADEAPWPAPALGWYAVGVLFVCAVFSFLDRQILSLMVEEIKRDLGLSEVQVGLLQGLPFAVFYAVMSLPIAVMADVMNRRGIIAVSVAFWSLATAACGLAGNFVQIFLARMAVGIGEAGLSPAAYSLISDYFPKERLGLAMGLYTMGNLAGVGLAIGIGGLVLELLTHNRLIDLPLVGTVFSWQVTFFVVGLPGLLLALVVMTIFEPARRGAKSATPATQALSFDRFFGNFGPFLVLVKQHRVAFATLFASFTVLVLMAYANFSWIPTFLRRTYGFDAGDIAWTYGTVVGVAGTAGAAFGGWLNGYLARKGYTDAPYRATLLCTLPMAPFALLTLLAAPNGYVAMLFFTPWQFFGAVPAGLAATAMMSITPNDMRAKISAIYLFISNILGITIGAWIVAVLTEHVFGFDGAVRYSLAIVNALGAPVAVMFIMLGMKPYRESLASIARADATAAAAA